MDKASLRQIMHAKRRALSDATRLQAAQSLAQHLSQQTILQENHYLAFYLAKPPELDPSPLLTWALAQNKACFLPCLDPTQEGHLQFAPYTLQTPLQYNRYGILEPVCPPEQRVEAEALEVICLPLLAFDRQGGRLGMGMGYYDRSLAQGKMGPWRLGLAYACQEVPQVPQDPWDVRLQAVATETAYVLVP